MADELIEMVQYVRAVIIRQKGFIQLLTEVLAVRLEPIYMEVQRYWSVKNIKK